MSENNREVDPILVDKVREFLATRWALLFNQNDSESYLNDLLPNLDMDVDSVLAIAENTKSDALLFVKNRIDEFGDNADYVLGLINDESIEPEDIVAFVRKFDYTTKN